MKRLILTSSSGLDLGKSGFAELVIPFCFRFVWGPLPPFEKLAGYFAARSENLRPGDHWSDWVIRWPRGVKKPKNLALADFCEPYDAIELWFDPDPGDQLQLIWLLDQLGSHPDLLPKLKLRLVAFDLIMQSADSLAKSEPHVPLVDVRVKELDTASRAWQAYGAPTPEACFSLIRALPMLKPALLDLLAELCRQQALVRRRCVFWSCLRGALPTQTRCFT